MVDLTEGFDDPAIGKATIIVAPPPGFGKTKMIEQLMQTGDLVPLTLAFHGQVDRNEYLFMPQMLGRAWRPGNKPRLAWDAEMQCWLFDDASVERLRRFKPPTAMRYRAFEINFNRINGTL